MASNRPRSASSDASSTVRSMIRKYDPVVDLEIRHLGFSTLHRLSLHLDPETNNNWVTLGELLDFSNLEILKLGEERDRTAAIIRAYGVSCATVGKLIHIIHDVMGRQDVFTDENVLQGILADADRVRRRSNGCTPLPILPCGRNYGGVFDASSFGSFPTTPTASTVSRDYPIAQPAAQDTDVSSTEPISTQNPLLIFDDCDRDFVSDKILPKVEVQWNMKLCIPQRDLPAFQLMSENFRRFVRRSRKIIVVPSDELFEGRDGDWLANFILDESTGLDYRVLLVQYKQYSAKQIFEYIPCCEFCETTPENIAWQCLRENLM